MDQNVRTVVRKRLERTAQALRSNRMQAFVVEGREQALSQLLALLPQGCTVTHGGSMTLAECGVPQALRQGNYHYLDRAAAGLTGEQIGQLYRQAFSADCYLGSANAVTEEGELYNVDGNGNRVAAYLYGPRSVILIVGSNKVVAGRVQAEERLRSIAAPANVARLGCATPCASSGICMDCKSPARICCGYVWQGFQREEGRIKVILTEESLGY